MTYLFSVNAALTPSAGRCPGDPCMLVPVFSRTVYPLYASLREKLSRMNSVAQENIAGNKTVRAFVREAYENEKLRTATKNTARQTSRPTFTG